MNPNNISRKKDNQFIQCHIGDGVYGLNTAPIDRVERSDNLHIEEGENGVVGFLNKSIPVIDLSKRLGSALKSHLSDRRIIVLNGEEGFWGLMVDRVSQVHTIDKENLFPIDIPILLNDHATNYFDQVADIDEGFLLILSTRQLELDLSNRSVELAQIPMQEALGRSQQPANFTATLDAPAGPGQIAIFRGPYIHGDMFYALSISQISEIIEAQELFQIPMAPEFIAGFVKWRRQPILVLNLCHRLGIQCPSGQMGKSRLIIARMKLGTETISHVGLMVDPSIQILKLPIRYSAPDSQIPFDPVFAKAVVTMNDQLLMVPDLQNLFTLPSNN